MPPASSQIDRYYIGIRMQLETLYKGHEQWCQAISVTSLMYLQFLVSGLVKSSKLHRRTYNLIKQVF